MVSTVERVSSNTRPEINQCIASQTERNIEWYKSHPEHIGERIGELEREWDIERVVETQSSSLVVLGTILGLTVNRKFLIMPLLVGGFLLQHGIQGWCPPIPLLRRLGVRTQSEIDSELHALKAMQH